MNKKKIELLDKSCKEKDEKEEKCKITIAKADVFVSVLFHNENACEKESSQSKKK